VLSSVAQLLAYSSCRSINIIPLIIIKALLQLQPMIYNY